MANGLDINDCVLSYFERTANLHCYTSCTLTTLHCSKVSFIQCCHVQKCERCTDICEILYVYIYIYIYQMQPYRIRQITKAFLLIFLHLDICNIFLSMSECRIQIKRNHSSSKYSTGKHLVNVLFIYFFFCQTLFLFLCPVCSSGYSLH